MHSELEAKMDVCKQVNRTVGHHVQGLGDLLSVLTSPDVLPKLENLITQIKEN
jgi:hypothetical protein